MISRSGEAELAGRLIRGQLRHRQEAHIEERQGGLRTDEPLKNWHHFIEPDQKLRDEEVSITQTKLQTEFEAM